MAAAGRYAHVNIAVVREGCSRPTSALRRRLGECDTAHLAKCAHAVRVDRRTGRWRFVVKLPDVACTRPWLHLFVLCGVPCLPSHTAGAQPVQHCPHEGPETPASAKVAKDKEDVRGGRGHGVRGLAWAVARGEPAQPPDARASTSIIFSIHQFVCQMTDRRSCVAACVVRSVRAVEGVRAV